jgi:hypothetical protein
LMYYGIKRLKRLRHEKVKTIFTDHAMGVIHRRR